MPDIYLVLYLVYAVCGLGAALWMQKWGPWALVLGSFFYVSFFCAAGVSMVFTSRELSSPMFEFVGQLLMVFYAIVGGSLFSTGWGELRAKARTESASKNDS